MASTINYLSLTGLQKYDVQIKSFIDSKVNTGVANSFKYVNLVDGELRFYTVNPITEDTKADFAIELPEQDLSNLMQLVKEATKGNIATFGDNGQVVDSGIKASDIAVKSEVEAVQSGVDANAEAIEALEGLVGELPEGTSAASVVEYVNIKTAGIATDAALEELNNQVSGLQTAVQGIQEDYLKEEDKTELQGNIDGVDAKADANAEAIKAISDDYLKADDKTELEGKITANASAIELLTNGVSAEEVDGVNDLIQYVKEHGTEVTGMKEDISENAAAIAKETEDREAVDTEIKGRLKVLEAIDHEAYVAADEALAASIATEIDKKADSSALEAEVEAREALDARVEAVEGKAHEHANSEVLEGITAEKVSAWDSAEANAKAYVDEKIEGVDLSGIATNASDIDKLEASLAEGGATYVSISTAQAAADKAQSEVDALETLHAEDKASLVAADEAMAKDIAALKEIEYVEIQESDIDALFEVAE